MIAAMNTRSLHEALARLHTELQGARQLDAESSQLLKNIAADIERLRSGANDVPQTSRLESLAVRFEAGHPALAASLREIADVLGRAGV